MLRQVGITLILAVALVVAVTSSYPEDLGVLSVKSNDALPATDGHLFPSESDDNHTTASESSIAVLKPDWSAFDISDDVLDIQESINVVKLIPVQYFWDFHKGQFKFGILGESVEEVFPQFVTHSKRKYSVDSHIYNVTSANTDVIFTHLVRVVQHLALHLAYAIDSTVERLLAEGDNFALKIIRIANETGVEWRTAKEIRTSREVVEIKKRIVHAESLRALTKHRHRNDTFYFYNAKKVEMLDAQHEHILEAIFSSHSRQDTLEQQKQQKLKDLSELTENKRRETQLSILQHAHDAAIDRLAVEVELGIKAINFRATEEGRIGRENEDVSLSIMKAKGESLRKGFEEVVTMLHLKASMVVHDAFEDPGEVFKYFLVVAAALSLYIVLVETALALRAYLTSKVSTPAVLKQAWTQKSNSSACSEKLILSTENASRLNSVSRVFQLAQTHGKGGLIPVMLPNVLIVGPPGTGKSMSAQSLAENSGFPFVVVCGGDLLAVGGGSSEPCSARGRYLRDVLHGARGVNKGKGFLVILDEVDTVITDRGKRKDRLDQELQDSEDDADAVSLESKECIHILLNTLRLNSSALGVIITTSLGLKFIDPALLDRMDRVMTLGLPDVSLRLTHVLHCTRELLSAYMEQPSLGWLDTLCNASEEGSDVKLSLKSSSNEDFSEAVGNVLGSGVRVDDLLCDKEDDVMAGVGRVRGGGARKKRGEGKGKRELQGKESMDTGDASVAPVASEATRFNLLRCLLQLLQCSEGWSHRELAKIIQNIQSDVIATEECVLTSKVWAQQVHFKARSKQTCTHQDKELSS